MSETDIDLIERYARQQAEDAFAELVRRHLGLVYSAALRQVRSPPLAEEVSQSVFTDLARSAGKLKPNTVLSAWLYQVTRRTAIDVVRREASRQLREQAATEMNAINASDSSLRNPMEAAANWTHIEPLLDEALQALDDTDRTAVLLRYFENKSLREVGDTLGASENAAQKRLTRAVERLRAFFRRRGVTVGASGLVLVISANAVHAAPVGLSDLIAIGATAFVSTAAPVASTLAPGILMASARQKALIIGGGVLALTLGGTAIFVVSRSPAVSRTEMSSIGLSPKTGFQIRWIAAEHDVSLPAELLYDASTNAGRREYRVLKNVVLNDEDVESASLGSDQGEKTELLVLLNNQGRRKFAEATTGNVGRQVAIVWNGRVLSAPIIRSAITGPEVKVTGSFDESEAKVLLDALNHR